VSASLDELVGREDARVRIAGLLAAARAGRSGVLVLTGEAGIGKSALCAWAVGQADGMRVVAVRGIESEADLPFAGLAELCADHLDDVADLPGPQAAALEAALARRPAGRGDRFAIGAGLLGLLAHMAEDRPLLLVVDDLQWVDPTSADALVFAARRLRSEGVAVLLAGRHGFAVDLAETATARLEVGPLAAPDARHLLFSAYPDVQPAAADLIVDAAAGSPLALLEIPRSLEPAQLAARAPLDTPLPLGPTLERALIRRVAGLPGATLAGLLVAAANDTERLQPVVDAMARLPSCGGVPALEPAERAGVIALAGDRLSFAHPLLRSAVYHHSPEPARRAAHRALAEVTTGEARAWHLARACVGEDEALAAWLDAIGMQARLRGAPAAAAAALERAARLTPPGPTRARRLVEAASDAFVAGREAAALDMLDEAARHAEGAAGLADVERVRGRILVLHGEARAAFRLLVDAAGPVRDEDPERAAALLAEACLDCLASADIAGAVATARDAVRLAERAGPVVQAFAASMLGGSLTLRGDAAEATALIDRITPVLLEADPLTDAGTLLAHSAQACIWLERYELASRLLERLICGARDAGAPAALPWPLVARAVLNLRLGRWELAAADAEEALALGEQTAQFALSVYALDCRARVAAVRGEEERCRRDVERALVLVERHRVEPGCAFLRSTLGVLELGLGRIRHALEHLETVRRTSERHGVREPRVLQWQADLAEARVRAGDLAGGRSAVDELTRAGQRSGGAWTRGAAARGRGLLAPVDEAAACFDAALEHFEGLPAPFEAARTHLCRGERLRRAGRRADARRALQTAIDAFDVLGAAPWAARGRQELRATGATPRGRREGADRDALTAHELQVARVVASGATNREAAAALFLSPKTVEFHLGHIYRKLGVRSRSELVARAAREGWLADADADADADAGTGAGAGAGVAS